MLPGLTLGLSGDGRLLPWGHCFELWCLSQGCRHTLGSPEDSGYPAPTKSAGGHAALGLALAWHMSPLPTGQRVT